MSAFLLIFLLFNFYFLLFNGKNDPKSGTKMSLAM